VYGAIGTRNDMVKRFAKQVENDTGATGKDIKSQESTGIKLILRQEKHMACFK
jgi:hypothetical protein